MRDNENRRNVSEDLQILDGTFYVTGERKSAKKSTAPKCRCGCAINHTHCNQGHAHHP